MTQIPPGGSCAYDDILGGAQQDAKRLWGLPQAAATNQTNAGHFDVAVLRDGQQALGDGARREGCIEKHIAALEHEPQAIRLRLAANQLRLGGHDRAVELLPRHMEIQLHRFRRFLVA